MVDYVTPIVMKGVIEFHNEVISFCKKKKIETSFKNYLNFKESESSYVSDNFQRLYSASKYYLVSSRAFSNYYKKLDHDFQQDIITKREYRLIKQDIKSNINLFKKVKNILGEDFNL
jgi:hypothetical protein